MVSLKYPPLLPSPRKPRRRTPKAASGSGAGVGTKGVDVAAGGAVTTICATLPPIVE